MILKELKLSIKRLEQSQVIQSWEETVWEFSNGLILVHNNPDYFVESKSKLFPNDDSLQVSMTYTGKTIELSNEAFKLKILHTAKNNNQIVPLSLQESLLALAQ